MKNTEHVTRRFAADDLVPRSELSLQQWQLQLSKHRSRVQTWTEPFLERRKRGQSHAIHDFLFVYYRYSPAKLQQWHPSVGVLLRDAHVSNRPAWFSDLHYRVHPSGMMLEPRSLKDQAASDLARILVLLRNTKSNVSNFACFGMHEWAMVYQGKEIRHAETTPLRIAQEEIDQFVESRPISCTHFDAFRFFADSARPLNRVQPTSQNRDQHEQTACIHANMDLYKWAYKSMPWVGSDLLWRCFELAMAARVVDMRASPYDLDGFPPIRVETSAGRREYESAQRKIYESAVPLRSELIESLESVLHPSNDVDSTVLPG